MGVIPVQSDMDSSDHDILHETAEEVRRLGITPYAVGIGDADPSELRVSKQMLVKHQSW